jgi:hypothetical protein
MLRISGFAVYIFYIHEVIVGIIKSKPRKMRGACTFKSSILLQEQLRNLTYMFLTAHEI